MPNSTPWTVTGTIPVPSGALGYAAMGQGAPVILLHKLGGWKADWRAIAAQLAQEHRVIALDLTGHGDSQADPFDGWVWPLEKTADDVLAALDALGVESAALVGNSLGGCAAMDIAARFPDRVEKMVLISTSVRGAATREQVEQSEKRESKWFDDEGIPLPRSPETIAKISGTLDLAIGEEQNASRAKAGKWVQRTERGVGLADLPALLRQAQCPVLLMYGERDPLIDEFETNALKMARDIRSVRIPNAGRFPHQEAPAATAAALLTFLDS